MGKFNIGDKVFQKAGYYSFLSDDVTYTVYSLCGDGFMYLEEDETGFVAVWQEDFILLEKP